MKVGGQIREVVRVRLEAKLDDIWSVAELINDTQHNLFFDPKTAEKRQGQFWPQTSSLHGKTGDGDKPSFMAQTSHLRAVPEDE